MSFKELNTFIANKDNVYYVPWMDSSMKNFLNKFCLFWNADGIS